jgi:hypothetical protein
MISGTDEDKANLAKIVERVQFQLDMGKKLRYIWLDRYDVEVTIKNCLYDNHVMIKHHIDEFLTLHDDFNNQKITPNHFVRGHEVIFHIIAMRVLHLFKN